MAIDLNSEILRQLTRIADALERQANGGEPTAPDMRRPIEDYHAFDWESINASIINADNDGPTIVEWGGTLWKRRSATNKFGEAVWYSRASGKDEAGENKYLCLIKFQRMSEVDPLPAKTAAAVNKPAPGPARLPTVASPLKPAPAQAAPAAVTSTDAVDAIVDSIHAKMDLYYRRPLISEAQAGLLAPAIESAFPTGDHAAKRHAALLAICGRTSLKEIDINQASLLFHWLKPYQDGTKNWQINADSAKDLLRLVAELDKLNQLPLA